MKSRYTYIAIAIVLAAIFAACSTTKRIPEGEVLYTGLKGVKITPDSVKIPSGVGVALHDAVDVAPNKKMWFLFPVGLWVHNWNVTDSTKGLKRKIYDRLAQDPVLVSEVRPQLRVKMLDEILDNSGYFRGKAEYELVHSKGNEKKASILYTVNPGPAYMIDSIQFLPDTTHLNHMIDSIARSDSYFHKGERFSMDSLHAVRTRISNTLRNRGYYFFRPEYIEYLADSLINPGNIALRLDLASNVSKYALQRYKVGKVDVNIYRNQGDGYPDTIELRRGMTLMQMKPSRLRKQIITENVMFRPGRYISARSVDNTQTRLSRLGIFNGINVEAFPDTTASEPTVDVFVTATFDTPLEASFELNASSKSNSYIGPGMAFNVTNHNLFGGGEQFTVGLTGSYEWATGRGSSSVLNSYELGINASLAFPRLLAPKFIPRSRRNLNWTRISLSGEGMNRPHFFKLAQVNAAISYDWSPSRYVTNTFTPLKLTYNKLLHTTTEFDSIMAANPAVALSFQNQFIPQMIYNFAYNKDLTPDDNLNVQVQVSEAGNIMWSLYELCGVKGEKKLVGTPFSQFVKGQVQVVYGHKVGPGASWLVSRVAVGAAHAYGNSAQVPYSEQFYCGGANSVRAFVVRSIGPGSYHQPLKDGDYFDQTGTFKFEANVEYRFPIFGPLNGAVFLDAGNVWLLKKDSMRPGGLLQGSTFFKDLATGTGVGLRFDIGMLVLRGDLGIGIHAPYDTGKRGYYNMESFKKSLAFHLAIGYPF